MKKLYLFIFVMLVATGLALAQQPPFTSGACPVGTVCTGTPYTPPNPGALPAGISNTNMNVALGQDVLGAHNGYGRGCVMCHAPHGGALGNNAPGGTGTGTLVNPATGNIPYGAEVASDDTGNGSIALWGENLAPYYGATATFTGTYTVTLPASASAATASTNSGAEIVLLCLSCHDGALTRVAMMAGQTVEALPIVGGSAPTLFGTTVGNSALTYQNEHPVGVSVKGSSWNCASGIGGPSGTAITPASCDNSAFTKFTQTDYPASFWNNSRYALASFATASGGATSNGVTCTTCHNQHSMTVFTAGNGTNYPTMFFINGEYMPSTGGNSVAQFCRNCHGSESNEYVGLTVPTT